MPPRDVFLSSNLFVKPQAETSLVMQIAFSQWAICINEGQHNFEYVDFEMDAD